MNTRTVVLMTLVCVPACRPSLSPPAGTPPAAETVPDARQRAVAARDALFRQLSTRLMQAIGTGGPAKAIEVCSQEAPQIAAAVAEEHHVAIGRTSFQLRNPRNQPPAWARPLIEQRPTDPRFVELPDQRTGALLPIRLQAQCTACHGPRDQISPEVRDQLDRLYPEDEATGFQEGDLRGWFWVEVPAA